MHINYQLFFIVLLYNTKIQKMADTLRKMADRTRHIIWYFVSCAQHSSVALFKQFMYLVYKLISHIYLPAFEKLTDIHVINMRKSWLSWNSVFCSYSHTIWVHYRSQNNPQALKAIAVVPFVFAAGLFAKFNTIYHFYLIEVPFTKRIAANALSRMKGFSVADYFSLFGSLFICVTLISFSPTDNGTSFSFNHLMIDIPRTLSSTRTNCLNPLTLHLFRGLETRRKGAGESTLGEELEKRWRRLRRPIAMRNIYKKKDNNCWRLIAPRVNHCTISPFSRCTRLAAAPCRTSSCDSDNATSWTLCCRPTVITLASQSSSAISTCYLWTAACTIYSVTIPALVRSSRKLCRRIRSISASCVTRSTSLRVLSPILK